MSENYPSDVKLNENPDGTVSFATEVVATIAGLAATEVDGVASMSSPSSGFADMFSRKNTRNFTKGVRIDLDGNRVTVDITIVVEYGSPVREVARNIQENVKKALETMTGLEVKSVDIHVSGISFEREQKANAELTEQHRKMLERNAESAAGKPEPAPEASKAEEEAEEEEIVEEEEEEDFDGDDVEEEEDDEAGQTEDADVPEPQPEARETVAEVAPPRQPEPVQPPVEVVEAPAESAAPIEDEPELIPGDEEPLTFDDINSKEAE